MEINVATLPETNSSPLKMDGWKTIVSYWGGLFSGAMLVSGRVMALRDKNGQKNAFIELFLALGIQSPKLGMVMEPKYHAQEVIGHPNHQLRIWLDA